jgi:hypothetical protein
MYIYQGSMNSTDSKLAAAIIVFIVGVSFLVYIIPVIRRVLRTRVHDGDLESSFPAYNDALPMHFKKGDLAHLQIPLYVSQDECGIQVLPFPLTVVEKAEVYRPDQGCDVVISLDPLSEHLTEGSNEQISKLETPQPFICIDNETRIV